MGETWWDKQGSDWSPSHKGPRRNFVLSQREELGRARAPGPGTERGGVTGWAGQLALGFQRGPWRGNKTYRGLLESD